MAIVRWDPFRDVAALQDRINRIFNESFGRSRDIDDEVSQYDWSPPVDIYETALTKRMYLLKSKITC
jgi:HSP20 family protein